MIQTDMTRRAEALAREAHRGQKDKGGQPYILHPLAVAQSMADEVTASAALLHDVMEDCAPMYAERIRKEFPEEVVRTVEILTRKDGVLYEEYIAALARNPQARKIKIADLKHNLDESRLPESLRCSPSAQARREKYLRALNVLLEIESMEVHP